MEAIAARARKVKTLRRPRENRNAAIGNPLGIRHAENADCKKTLAIYTRYNINRRQKDELERVP
jgi:hypothetical protein